MLNIYPVLPSPNLKSSSTQVRTRASAYPEVQKRRARTATRNTRKDCISSVSGVLSNTSTRLYYLGLESKRTSTSRFIPSVQPLGRSRRQLVPEGDSLPDVHMQWTLQERTYHTTSREELQVVTKYEWIRNNAASKTKSPVCILIYLRDLPLLPKLFEAAHQYRAACLLHKLAPKREISNAQHVPVMAELQCRPSNHEWANCKSASRELVLQRQLYPGTSSGSSASGKDS